MPGNTEGDLIKQPCSALHCYAWLPVYEHNTRRVQYLSDPFFNINVFQLMSRPHAHTPEQKSLTIYVSQVNQFGKNLHALAVKDDKHGEGHPIP